MSKPARLRSVVLFSLLVGLVGCNGSSSEDADGPVSLTGEETTVEENEPTGDDDADGDGDGEGEGEGNESDEISEEPQSALASVAPLSPVIRSGFESGTIGAPVEAITHFSGVDASSAVPNDWSQLSAGNSQPNIGYFEIQYQGGDTTNRYARLSPDPDNPENQSLEFWLHDENVNNSTDTNRDLRGRVQANLYGNPDLTSYYQSVRVRFGQEFADLIEQPETFNWLTLFEAWNGANWIAGEEYPFHIALNLSKPEAAAGSPLHFLAHGRSYVFGVGFDEHWADTNTDFSVPLETWMTLEMYILQGDADTGRFYMTAQVDGEGRTVLFDIADYTHNPRDLAPTGFDYINPMKLYTLESVLDLVNINGGSMVVHWDDLEFGYTSK